MSLLLTNKNASMMRRFYLLIYMAAIAGLLSSCVKEELEYGCTKVEEGLPARVSLDYKVQRRDVVTRAAQASRYEYRNGQMILTRTTGRRRRTGRSSWRPSP